MLGVAVVVEDALEEVRGGLVRTTTNHAHSKSSISLGRIHRIYI